MDNKIRVRFAPSPTGPLHIGGVRTALFNYLYAKKQGGDFILRIEDTDQKRYVAEAEDYIVKALEWCGMNIDEGPNNPGEYGPYRQSERKDIYAKYAEQLIKDDKAYYAFDTPEQLDIIRKEYEDRKETFIYNWHNREAGHLKNSLVLSEAETKSIIENGEPYVIRFKTPTNKKIQLKDEIRGDIVIDSNTLDDKILFKNDGMPTYHLANIVDDHLMKITHVIRGEEWLPSMALHHLLYEALGWESPSFAHLPLILKPTGKGKLSKRDGDKLGFPVFPLEWKDSKTNETSRGYKEDGYFTEAVTNFLALLGWNPGTEQEIFSLEELINNFSLEKVNKSGARFDPEKIKWFNNHYLQEKSSEEIATLIKEQDENKVDIDIEFIKLTVDLVKERASFIEDFKDLTEYFYEAPKEYNEKNLKKAIKEDSKELLQEFKTILEKENFDSEEKLTTNIKAWITSKEIGFGKIMMPLRIALVGSLQGADVFTIAFLLGKNETLKRLNNLINII